MSPFLSGVGQMKWLQDTISSSSQQGVNVVTFSLLLLPPAGRRFNFLRDRFFPF